MGFLDKLKGTASSVKHTADKALDQHGDKIATGVEKAGGAVNKATKGKYADKVDKGVGMAKKPLAKTTGPTAAGTSGTGLGADPVDSIVTPGPIPTADGPLIDDGTTGTMFEDDTRGTGSPGTSGGSMPGSPPAATP